MSAMTAVTIKVVTAVITLVIVMSKVFIKNIKILDMFKHVYLIESFVIKRLLAKCESVSIY